MRDLVHHRRHLEKNDDSVPNQCHFFMSAILLRIRVTLLTPEGEIACVTAAPHSKSQKYTKNKKTTNKTEQQKQQLYISQEYIHV